MAAPQGAWKQGLAQQLGIKLTPAVSTFFDAWARAEGGGATNNPFNTTQQAPGASSYNSVGVRNYGSPEQGLQATVETLMNGKYGNILGALRAGRDPMAMAQALASSPWGTGSLVEKILGGGGPVGPPPPAAPGAPDQSPVTMPLSGALAPQDKLQQALNMAMPGAGAASLLAPLGGTAEKAMAAASQPFTIPGAGMTQASQAPSMTTPQPDGSGSAPKGPQADPYTTPTVPVQSKLTGQVPMHVGGNVGQKYPNIRAGSNVDWQHVNPRLLNVLQQVAQKEGAVIVLNSGYRSNQYSQHVGGFAGDPHTRGVAVDAYINGHPIGDVIPPETWAKYGIRSGNTPGFFNGKPDPEHLDLIGIPIKGGR